MTKLYEISNALASLHHELEESGGILSDELEKKLDSLSLSFTEKAEGIVKLTRNLEGDELAIENEIHRLQNRLNSISGLRNRLENYIKTSMEVAGKEEVNLGIHNIAIVNNPPSAEEVDREKTPAHFITIKTEKIISKREILDALKRGEEVPGWKLTHKTRLKIR